MKKSLKLYLIAAIAIISVLVAGWLWLRHAFKESGIKTSPVNERVVSTKAVLDSIRSIGEWELANVEAQVDVDTVVKRWMGLRHSRLQRRYHGRLSVGIDLRKVSLDKDSAFVLPAVCLLDSNFIDESRTELIVCENKGIERDSKIKIAMLRKARDMMIRDVMKPALLSDCEKRAKEEIRRLSPK